MERDKDVQKKLLGLAASLGLVGCAAPPMQYRYPEVPAEQKTLALDGVEFAAPGEPGWHMNKQTPYVLSVGKLGSSEDDTLVIDAMLFKAPDPVPGKDWTQQVKEGEDADTSAPRFVMTLHDVEAVKVGTATCARSHMIAEDHAPTTHSGKKGVMILEALSLNCRHPDDPKVGVEVGYSERYWPGQGEREFMKRGLNFLSSVHFTKLVPGSGLVLIHRAGCVTRQFRGSLGTALQMCCTGSGAPLSLGFLRGSL